MFEITAFNCNRMRATTRGIACSWFVHVEITTLCGKVECCTASFHFNGDQAERKATAYANAINMVDDQFHSIKTVLDRSIARAEA